MMDVMLDVCFYVGLKSGCLVLVVRIPKWDG